MVVLGQDPNPLPRNYKSVTLCNGLTPLQSRCRYFNNISAKFDLFESIGGLVIQNVNFLHRLKLTSSALIRQAVTIDN